MLRTAFSRTNASAIVRSATQVNRFAAPVLRRGYAEAAPKSSDTLKLSMSVPHQSIFSNKEVTQVNIPSTAGDMGILSHHVPSIVQLRPGLIEVISEGNAAEKYFVSGGFATIQPGNLLSINAVEAYSLEDFSAEAVRSRLADAQRVASGSGSEEEVAEARIEVEVYEALQAAGIR